MGARYRRHNIAKFVEKNLRNFAIFRSNTSSANIAECANIAEFDNIAEFFWDFYYKLFCGRHEWRHF